MVNIVQQMTVPPYVCGAVGLYIFALSSDRRQVTSKSHYFLVFQLTMTQTRKRVAHHSKHCYWNCRADSDCHCQVERRQIRWSLHFALRMLRVCSFNCGMAKRKHTGYVSPKLAMNYTVTNNLKNRAGKTHADTWRERIWKSCRYHRFADFCCQIWPFLQNIVLCYPRHFNRCSFGLHRLPICSCSCEPIQER